MKANVGVRTGGETESLLPPVPGGPEGLRAPNDVEDAAEGRRSGSVSAKEGDLSGRMSLPVERSS